NSNNDYSLNFEWRISSSALSFELEPC
ncbi:unnamed protein product, partial [Allacma fusca]